MADSLKPHARVLVYDKGQATGLAEVAAADFVVLAVPLAAYDEVLSELKPLLRSETVVVDVCSVKQKPIGVIKAVLPEQPLVATHPLFGPESTKNGLEGHKLVICPEESDADASEAIEAFAKKLGLEVIHMSPAEHDEEMAVVQGLTFFIAHALKELNLDGHKLGTPSFGKLLQLSDLEKHHSLDLFMTIQAGNQRTGAVRRRFIELCETLDSTIRKTPADN